MPETDQEILSELHKVFDTTQYGLGTKFREIRKSLGLFRTREQAHTVEGIRSIMTKLRSTYPQAGAREMISHLFHSYGMQCRRFWAAGVNDIWAVDQHDKWQRFGLRLHTGIEPFSGRILWMKVWHSNRNSQLILLYYLACAQEFGFIPMITQSDPGTENIGIANAQTLLCQMHDPTLEGFVQHRWMRTKKNIMPEIAWSQLRRRFTPGFEALLEEGVDAGWYDSDNTLQIMVFRWLFIPWLQQELDSYQQRVNNTWKRCDKKKILPHGVPELIHRCAEDYAALDFKVMVSCEALDHVRRLYINDNHPVFDLVPPSLDYFISQCYDELGRPVVERDSIWYIYCTLLDLMKLCEGIQPVLDALQDLPNLPEVDMELSLLLGLEDLPEVKGYMGGVGNGMGLQEEHVAALDALEYEGISDIALDAVPELWVDAFSSDEDEKDEMDEVESNL
ncbi:hypothetical protein L210DRAFT_3614625 [Boletus edulis BED1]|uniref:Integrase core domain-containing protein n=1 Tax=Boletus edulis BED1 TaxID=1328754 RepID=A0AAD4BHX3_BOLED|nr:hypothetical protein L210DRAFT_3614625 [Boletus edulis BED1]